MACDANRGEHNSSSVQRVLGLVGSSRSGMSMQTDAVLCYRPSNAARGRRKGSAGPQIKPASAPADPHLRGHQNETTTRQTKHLLARRTLRRCRRRLEVHLGCNAGWIPGAVLFPIESRKRAVVVCYWNRSCCCFLLFLSLHKDWSQIVLVSAFDARNLRGSNRPSHDSSRSKALRAPVVDSELT